VTLPSNSVHAVPRKVRAFFWAGGTLILAASCLFVVVTTLDGPHSRLNANEASAVSKLRTIITLQHEYKAAHAHTGFACELSSLKTLGQQTFPDYSLQFLTAGVQSGYRFSLVSCGSDTNQATVRYQLVAAPIERGTTGIMAFCADQTGVIWWDRDGSAASCLEARHTLE